MKKTVKICLVVLVCVLLIGGILVIRSLVRDNSDDAAAVKPPLNEMSAEECYRTLFEYGFVLPEAWEDSSEDSIIEFAKTNVDYIYRTGGGEPHYSFTGSAEFAERLWKVVCEYEGFEYPREELSDNQN